jgi:hypothetical protein
VTEPTTHRQVSVPAPEWEDAEAVEVDEKLGRLLRLLWRAGCETHASCQHVPRSGHQASISFVEIDKAEWFARVLEVGGLSTRIQERGLNWELRTVYFPAKSIATAERLVVSELEDSA